jgi:predicted RNA-binding protein with PUA-like domain
VAQSYHSDLQKHLRGNHVFLGRIWGWKSVASWYTPLPKFDEAAAGRIAMAHWLMKSEPDVYSIDDLERDRREMWDSIRNYQARNMMRDDMRVGDEIFFYHSNCKEPAIAGISRVASEPYPDPTQFDPESRYFDPKSSKEEPRWILVDVEFVRKLKKPITLAEIKAHPGLDEMILTRRGNRLSIMPVSKEHWDLILTLE